MKERRQKLKRQNGQQQEREKTEIKKTKLLAVGKREDKNQNVGKRRQKLKGQNCYRQQRDTNYDRILGSRRSTQSRILTYQSRPKLQGAFGSSDFSAEHGSMLSETHGGKSDTMKHAHSVEVTRGNCSVWTRILISAVRRLVYICLSFFKHFLNSEPSAMFGRQKTRM